MDGFLALVLWDVVIEVLRSTNNTKRPIRQAPGHWCGTGNHSSNKSKTTTTTSPFSWNREGESSRDVYQFVECGLRTHQHTLFFSCTFLKTTKLSSRWLPKDGVQQWDMCPEPTELLLIGCSTGSVWNPKSKSVMLTPKNQLADMLTKGSFTRIERNHFILFFNIMNVSCGHFSNFLSDPIRKQNAMLKRGQEATSREGSQTAKPKPMISAMAKSRPMNLVLHNPLNARKSLPQDLSNPVNPGNVEKEPPSIRKLMRNPSQDPIEYSQVRRQKHSKCGHVETRRQGWIFELDEHKGVS